MKQRVLVALAGILVVIIGISLFFILSPKKYTITFDTAGGNVMEEVEVAKGTTILELEVPKKAGYTFLYWTVNGKVCNKTDEITSDMHLKAVWSKNEENPDTKAYVVTFNVDGGSTINAQEVEEGETLTAPTDPTKEGYIFVEWTLDGKTFDLNTKITKDITLKAKWEKVEEEKKVYTVTFNTDGGSKISSKKVTEGNKVSKPGNPTKEGYTFVSWTLNDKTYNFNSKVTSNITLKATWKKVETPKEEDKPVVVPTKYTVTFNTDGGSSVSSQTIEEGKTATKPSDPKKDNYKFIGWYLNGASYDFSKSITGNITLNAKWEKIEEAKTYTISISQVDAYSPDRYLTVYENGKAITVSKIMYTDGVEVMSTINGTKISVAYADIVGENTFKVKLTNGSTVTAKVIN